MCYIIDEQIDRMATQAVY